MTNVFRVLLVKSSIHMAAPTAQNSPELPFRFINYFIQSSLLRSLVQSMYTRFAPSCHVVAFDKMKWLLYERLWNCVNFHYLGSSAHCAP